MAHGRSLPLRKAIVLTVVLGLLVPVLLISGYSWLRQYTEGIERQTEEMLRQNADILSNGMQEPLWNINQESGNALVEAMMLRNEDIVRIEVRDSALGLFVAGQRPLPSGSHSEAREQPVVYNGTTIGSVRVEVSSERLRQQITRDLLWSIAAVLAQAAVSIALILILLEKRLVRPLHKLGVGAERLANRELETPFSWQSLDEIGMLGRRLEDTRLSLRRLFAELDHKNLELERDIDKRKRVEQELHEREERYRALVERSPIAIIEWDPAFRVAEWNDAAEKIFGYPREHAMGRHVSFILADGGQEGFDMPLRRWLENGVGSRYVADNRRADGKLIACQWSHARITGESGRPDRLLSIAEDITDKRRAEEALSLSEAKFAAAFQSNPDSVSLARLADGVLIDVNQSFERLTGFRRDEAVGKTAIQLGLWEDKQQRQPLFRQLSSQRTVRNYEWRMLTKHGALRRCVTNASVFEVAGESFMLAVIRDVTDQRLLEEQKSEADRVLLRLAQGTRDIAGEAFFDLLVADLASALRTDCAFIAMRNKNDQAMLTTIAAQLRGADVDNFSYASRGTPCEQTLAGDITLVAGDLRRVFPPASSLAGNAWHSYAGAPLRDSAGNTIGVLAVMHVESLGNPDLVRSLLQVFSERASAELERNRAENEILELNAHLEHRVIARTEELQQANRELAAALETLRMAQQELVRSEKLAALGSLVAGIAHELNTPIGNSLMVASTLADQTRSLASQYDSSGLKRSTLEAYIGEASTAGNILMRNLQRAADLVTGFKQVAVDQTSSQRRQFSVSELVSEIMLTLWPTLRKTHIEVSQEIPASLRMDSYPGPLGQALANLVNNALLHAFADGQSGRIMISASAENGWVELTVRDDGAGIPAANLNRIFDPFFTTRLGAGGSGLGLHITHNIVTGVLGGRIGVQSEPGKGTAFVLSLPMQAPARQSEDESLSPAA